MAGNVTPALSTSVDANGTAVVLLREELFPVDKVGNQVFADDSTKTVRRPIGLEYKKDKYAFIEVLQTEVSADGKVEKVVPLQLFNEAVQEPRGKELVGGGKANYANNFLIQQITETREEKYQLLETFGQDFIFFFGERPRFVDVQGILVNANSHQWKKEWLLNYNRYLRGSKATQNRSRVFLNFDDLTMGGYLLSTQTSDLAEEPRKTMFGFRMIVTDYFFRPYDTQALTLGQSGETGFVEDDVDEGESTHAFFANYLKAGATPAGFGDVDELAVLYRNIRQILGQVSGGVNQLLLPLLNQSWTEGAFSTAINAYGMMALGETFSPGDYADTFNRGATTLVEFRGKPLDLVGEAELTLSNEELAQKRADYRATGIGTALVDALNPYSGTSPKNIGTRKLNAVADNSLNILLSLADNPAIKILDSWVEGQISSAISIAGGKPGALQSVFGVDNGAARLRTRFAGFDITVPFEVIRINKLGPGNASSVEGNPGVSVVNFSPTTLDEVDIDAMIADPNFRLLPREWRRLMYKDPENASKRILAKSKLNSDSKLVLRLEINNSPRLPILNQVRKLAAEQQS